MSMRTELTTGYTYLTGFKLHQGAGTPAKPSQGMELREVYILPTTPPPVETRLDPRILAEIEREDIPLIANGEYPRGV